MYFLVGLSQPRESSLDPGTVFQFEGTCEVGGVFAQAAGEEDAGVCCYFLRFPKYIFPVKISIYLSRGGGCRKDSSCRRLST